MARAKKPNFLILWSDDLGIWNISHFIRWLGRIEAGSVLHGIVSHIDMLADQIKDFVELPPRQKPASFNLDAVPEPLSNPPA